METTMLLAVLGIVVSLAFGLWGVRLTLLAQRGGEITFVWEERVALFDSIVRHLPELGITYKAQAVRENLVLMTGALVNTGRFDITPTIVEAPVRLILPSGCKWMTATVLGTSAEVGASVKSEGDESLAVQTSLFRRGEWVRIRALAEIGTHPSRDDAPPGSPAEQLYRELRFNHRIANTKSIVFSHVHEPALLRGSVRRALALTLFCVGLLGGGLIAIGRPILPRQLIYPLNAGPNQEVREFLVRAWDEHDLMVKDLGSGEARVLGAEEYVRLIAGPPRSRRDPIIQWLFPSLTVVCLAMPSSLLWRSVRRVRQNDRLRKILGTDANHTL